MIPVEARTEYEALVRRRATQLIDLQRATGRYPALDIVKAARAAE
jgi:hypothetical protein